MFISRSSFFDFTFSTKFSYSRRYVSSRLKSLFVFREEESEALVFRVYFHRTDCGYLSSSCKEAEKEAARDALKNSERFLFSYIFFEEIRNVNEIMFKI